MKKRLLSLVLVAMLGVTALTACGDDKKSDDSFDVTSTQKDAKKDTKKDTQKDTQKDTEKDTEADTEVTLVENSLFSKVTSYQGYTFDQICEELDKCADQQVTITTKTGETWNLSSKDITADILVCLSQYSDTDTLEKDVEGFLAAKEDQETCVALLAACTAMGMVNGTDANATANIQKLAQYVVANCQVIDATQLQGALTSYAKTLTN